MYISTVCFHVRYHGPIFFPCVCAFCVAKVDAPHQHDHHHHHHRDDLMIINTVNTPTSNGRTKVRPGPGPEPRAGPTERICLCELLFFFFYYSFYHFKRNVTSGWKGVAHLGLAATRRRVANYLQQQQPPLCSLFNCQAATATGNSIVKWSRAAAAGWMNPPHWLGFNSICLARRWRRRGRRRERGKEGRWGRARRNGSPNFRFHFI